MSLRSRRCLQLLLPMIAVMCLSAAPQQQLNPTVRVLPAATSTVPPECEEGLAPQARPRVTTEEKIVARQIATPPELQAPPSNDLRTTLRDVQAVAERNDRASFVDSLARMKPILAAYPSGGERTAAEKAVAVYNDINTLWDYQLTPPGAFFDASSNLFKMLSAYPGYDTFIRRQVLVDQAGAKFYPSSESRAFLTQIAATRLKDLGIKTASASVVTPAVAHQPAATTAAHEKAAVAHETAKTSRTTTAVPTPHIRHATSAAPQTQRSAKPAVTKNKPPHIAEAKPAAPKKPAEAATVKTSATTKKTPAIATKPSPPETKTAASATTTHVERPAAATATTAAPAATHTVSETPVPPPSMTATTSALPTTVTSSDTAASATTATTVSETASSATATDTTATAATADTASTDTTGTAEKEQAGRPGEPRNLLWPIILIVVGVGVLILLFRSSPGPK